MAPRDGDRHAKDQLNIRVPPDFLARLKDDAKRHGQTQADIVVAGTTAELDRLDGIATSPAGAEAVKPPRARTRKPRADTAPAATFREPESATDIMAAIRRRRNGD